MKWNLIGHEWAANLLQKHVAHDRVRHAYLFTGPQGVGRRTLALRLAQALNCAAPPLPGQPCFRCRSCTQIERQAHPDLTIVQSEREGGTLFVEQVRELQRSLSLHPYEARYRVVLLLRFHEASASAQNALLMTLEEPAPQVVLLLTAESAESLLPTVVSRCELLRLRPLSPERLSSDLQERGLAADRAELLAHISGGRPGYALRLDSEAQLLEKRQVWLSDMMRLLSANHHQRFSYAETLSKDKDATREILAVWLSLWRDVFLRASGSPAAPANLDRRDEIERLAAHLGRQAAHQIVAAIERTIGLLSININPRLTTEVLMLDLPHVG